MVTTFLPWHGPAIVSRACRVGRSKKSNWNSACSQQMFCIQTVPTNPQFLLEGLGFGPREYFHGSRNLSRALWPLFAIPQSDNNSSRLKDRMHCYVRSAAFDLQRRTRRPCEVHQWKGRISRLAKKLSSYFLSSFLPSNFPNPFLTGETTWTDAASELNALITSTTSSLLCSGAKVEWTFRKLAFDFFFLSSIC